MIHLNYNSTKVITFYLQPSLSTPVYLLSLVNYTTRERKNFIAPESSTNSDLLQFTVAEVGEGAENILNGRFKSPTFGRFTIEVYEQASSTNLDIANATFLGDDELIIHKSPVYDNPPERNPIESPDDVSCTLVIDSISATDETSAGANDGTATVVISGAQGDIAYLWSTVDGNIPSGQEVLQSPAGLSPGTYTVLATDNIAPSCTDSDSVTVEAAAITQPDDLSNLVGWVKADDETTINSGSVFDGEPVANVESVSPATHDYEQLTSNRQPTWFEDGFGTNDKPHIYCDGNECMSGINSLTDPYSIIVVVEPTDSTLTRRFICGSGLTADLNNEGALLKNSTSQLLIFSNSGTVTSATNVTLEPLIFKAIFNGSSSKIAINNSSYVTGDSGSVGMTNYGFGGYDSSGGFVLSSSKGKFAEIIIYSGAKTEAELDSLDAYINDKYDIY